MPPDDAQRIEKVALVAEAAAKKHEDNKCSLVDSGCATLLVEGLRSRAVSSSPDAVQAVCGCLKSLTTADDPRPAASRSGVSLPLAGTLGALTHSFMLWPTLMSRSVCAPLVVR